MNELLKKLEGSILAGRAMHAYLITGVDPETTDNAARTAASLMLYGRRDLATLTNDPDYMEYEGSVAMGDFRGVIRPEIYRETFGRNGRVVVFRNASLLSRMVQNAMLKVLEEPPENTRFILTGNEYGVLPTIRSRCMILRCPASDPSEIAAVLVERGASRAEAERYAAMSGGVSARAIRLYESEDARKLRDGAVSAFIAAMNGAPDFKWTKTKRERTEYLEANELMLLALRDLLHISCGLPAESFADRASELKRLCSRYGIRELCLVADALTENAERLSTNAPGGASFDRLFAVTAAIGNK